MSPGVFSGKERKEVEVRPLGAALRPVGRVALWAVLAVLLIRGGAALLESPERSPAEVGRAQAAGPGLAAEALAVRFARTYLESPSPNDLRVYLAEGAHLGAGHRPHAGGGVAQAEVVKNTRVGASRWVLTVSCDLRDARTLYLAVPIVRQAVGEAAALGAPSIVADPAPVRSPSWSRSSSPPTSRQGGPPSSPTCSRPARRRCPSAARSRSPRSAIRGSSAAVKAPSAN